MATKVVPERNPLKPTALTKQPTLVDNKDPRFKYEWFEYEDNKHPSYYARRTRPHEIGAPDVGYTVVDGWQVCNATTDPDVSLESPRDDQGKAVDTTIRHGSMVLCRTPVENAAKYELIHDRKVERNSKGLTDGERQVYGGGLTSSKVVVSPDANAIVDDMLKGIS